MKRYLRLTYLTWGSWLRAMLESVARWYSQRTCPHLFKAALVNGAGGRVCKICDLAQPLSREDFYAEFGERYQAMVYTQHVDPVIRRESHKPMIETDRVQ